MEKKSILLVENDWVVRDLIRGALEREYKVFEASGYSEAAEQLCNPIDLALVDYHLPDLDGFEVFKAVRNVKTQMPVILMTGYSNKDLAIKALRAGFTDYIEKPICFRYLLNKLSKILGRCEVDADDEYPGAVENRDEFVMDGIALYVKENYREALSLEKAAKMAGMDRYKFCKAFKERFGKGYISYLNRIRLEKAAELLENFDLNVTDISNFIGFGCIDHFIRIFKKKYGVSPGEYRKKLKQRN